MVIIVSHPNRVNSGHLVLCIASTPLGPTFCDLAGLIMVRVIRSYKGKLTKCYQSGLIEPSGLIGPFITHKFHQQP